jgi:ABC-type nitrate/sulfonate/bicarbonate transport system substrate-binding protein
MRIGFSYEPQVGAQLLIADREGLFAKEALETTLVPFLTGGEMVDSLVAGSCDVGILSEVPALIARANGLPFRIVAQAADISGTQAIVVTGSVQSPQDLDDKRIGYVKGGAQELLIHAFMRDYHLNADRLTLLNMTKLQMVQSFGAGEIEGVVVTGPFLWESLEAGRRFGAHLLHTASTSHISKQEEAKPLCDIHSVVLVHDGYLSTQADSIQALLRSFIRATDFINRDLGAAVALLSRESGLTPYVVEQLIRLTTYDVSCGEQVMISLRNNATVLRGAGALPADVDMRGFVDCRPYEDARLARAHAEDRNN